MRVPERIQQSRQHKSPPNTRSVARGKGRQFGNDYEIVYINKETNTFCIQNKKTDYASRMIGGEAAAHKHAVDMFRIQMEENLRRDPTYYDSLLFYDFISCFCQLEPVRLSCHCDPIIEHLTERIQILQAVTE